MSGKTPLAVMAILVAGVGTEAWWFAHRRPAPMQLDILRRQLAVAGEMHALEAARVQGGITDGRVLTVQRDTLAQLRGGDSELLRQEAEAVNRLSLLLGERPGALQLEVAPRPPQPLRPPSQNCSVLVCDAGHFDLYHGDWFDPVATDQPSLLQNRVTSGGSLTLRVAPISCSHIPMC